MNCKCGSKCTKLFNGSGFSWVCDKCGKILGNAN